MIHRKRECLGAMLCVVVILAIPGCAAPAPAAGEHPDDKPSAGLVARARELVGTRVWSGVVESEQRTAKIIEVQGARRGAIAWVMVEASSGLRAGLPIRRAADVRGLAEIGTKSARGSPIQGSDDFVRHWRYLREHLELGKVESTARLWRDLRTASIDAWRMLMAMRMLSSLAPESLDKANSYISGIDARRRNFHGANLSGERIPDARLNHVDLGNAILSGADLSSAVLDGADLSHAHLVGADFEEVTLRGANLYRVKGSKSNFLRSTLWWADFTEADLRDADLDGIRGYGACFKGARLDGAKMEDAGLRTADLTRASLRKTDLCAARLQDSDLRGADFSGASLRNTAVDGARFDGAILDGVDLRVESGLTVGQILAASSWSLTTKFPDDVDAELRARGQRVRGRVDGASNQKAWVDHVGGENGASSESTDLRRRQLVGAQLSDADLANASLQNANLRGAVLCGADLRRANMAGATLAGAWLDSANFAGAKVHAANLHRAHGTRVVLESVDLRFADMSEVRLVDADLRRMRAHGTRFDGAVLDGANMSHAELKLCDIRGASLRGAQLGNSKMNFVAFRGCDLTGADLRGAALHSVIFPDSILDGADLRVLDGDHDPRFGSGLSTKRVLAARSWTSATRFPDAVEAELEELGKREGPEGR